MQAKPSPNAGLRRTYILLLVMAVLLIVVVVKQRPYVGIWGPSLIFTNDYGDVDHFLVSVDGLTTDLGTLKDNARIVLPIKLSRGLSVKIQRTEIPPDEWERIIQLAKNERRDVQIGMDFHGCLTIEGWELLPWR